MPKPVAVISGDIHFTPATLELASAAVRQMQARAEELRVPMILNGDTLDSKDILRGGVVNALIELLKESDVNTYFNWGNHESTNERADTHTLHFLKPYATVIDTPIFVSELDSYIIPYFHDAAKLQAVLTEIPKLSRLIIHQGVQTAFMGAYTVDKSSLPKEAYADYRVIASHYHRAQDLKCGRPRKGAVGLFSYCGSPYSQSFGEAADGPKGFQVLYDDGLLEQVPTNLRKHVILECEVDHLHECVEMSMADINPGDLLWLKVTGTYQQLAGLNKQKIGQELLGHGNYRLEKIYTDTEKPEAEDKPRTGEDLMDALVDGTGEAEKDRTAMKGLWRTFV